MKKNKIGILIEKVESIFQNGCFQQAYFTYKALKNTGYDVILVTGDKDYGKYPFINLDIRFITMDQGIDDLSMLLFVSAYSEDINFLKKIKEKNIRIVNQIGGNYFILTQELITFDAHKRDFFIGNKYIDEIWLLPMYSFMKSYLNILSDRPVRIVPYVWDMDIINIYCNTNKLQIEYSLEQKNKDISIIIMEPNMSIHKTCLVPLVIAEGLYKTKKYSINKILCFCPPKNKSFERFISQFQIFKDKRIDFYDRMIMPAVLNGIKHWDNKFVLISNHILNNLNYLPMEFMDLGYPVIHNCEPYSDIGYYYPNHDISKAMDCFENIVKSHDKNHSEKLKHTKKRLFKYNPKNQKNINEYKKILDELHENSNNIEIIKSKNENVKILDELKNKDINENKAFTDIVIGKNINSYKPPTFSYDSNNKNWVFK